MHTTNDKVVIITGAGKGIGRGMAEYFAQNQWVVILATRTDKEGILVQDTINEQGHQSFFIQTDVADEKSIKNMVSLVLEKYGRIDALINNAGITRFKPLLECSIEDWNELINIDLRGVFLCSKYVAQAMVTKKIPGSIINISSNHAFRTLPDTEIYAAAKGGVNAMTRSMAISLGPYGIRANTICPGFTDTPHYQSWLAAKSDSQTIDEEIKALHAVGEITTPKDIAQLAFYLAGDESQKITGSEILIDGGLTARLYNSSKF